MGTLLLRIDNLAMPLIPPIRVAQMELRALDEIKRRDHPRRRDAGLPCPAEPAPWP